MAERKRRAAERDTRRESLLVLLSRMQRGALLDNERPLLRAHVETELGEADELRRTVQGQQTAIQAAHNRTTAAEDAIREMEQRALDAEEQLTAYRAVLGPRPLDTIRKAEQRAEQAEQRLAAYEAVFGPSAVEDFHKMQHRATTAERDLAAAEATAQRWHREAQRASIALQRVRDADRLGAALAAVAEAAESPRALLDEQARAHAIELAEWKRRNANQGETIRDMARANWEANARAHAAEERAEAATRIGVRHMATAERYEAAWRSARRRARAHAAEEQRVRGWLEHWADRARTAEGDLATIRNRDQLAAALLTIRDRAFRYRAAWHSARRGRAAAEAALAAELPDVIAGQQARAADPDRAQLARP
jgi:hypothetical protein